MTSTGLLRQTTRGRKEKVGCDWYYAGWRKQVVGLLECLLVVCVDVCVYYRPEEAKAG